ncbi:MAG TPA: Na+/H+ antiporter NhaA [Pseudomonadales bacterium]|nr:Na+/H+ antiporter NhaA [Pseudomonadales bacterium]
MRIKSASEFLELESASGIVLVAAAVVALAIANSPLASLYDAVIDVKLSIAIGSFGISKPLLLWINDGLMAVFFFLIGLEVKREMLEGELRNVSQVVLPGCAALGGFAVPAAIYAALNWNDPVALRGWAIPAATDIAFALGVLSMLGNRVPLSLKVFLTSLAIFDDIAAIVVIALFYATDLSFVSLAIAAVGIAVLIAFNVLGVVRIAAYVLVGIVVWVCVLKSGVHATLAGFVVALTIPLKHPGTEYDGSPLRHLEHILHPWVAFMILPVFAFANAGVSFAGMTMRELTGGVASGIALGLFVGKQLGVFATCLLLIKLKLAELPRGASWRALYGVSILTGIGFTMSLFVGGLAFEHSPVDYGAPLRAAVLGASVLSAIAGYLLLRGATATTAPESR